MGTSASKKDPFEDAVEINPFSNREIEAIKLRYKGKGNYSGIFQSNVQLLLEKKGLLSDVNKLLSFLGDAMRVNSSRTLEVFWDLLDDGETIDCRERLLRFFNLLLSLINHKETTNEVATEDIFSNVAESLVKNVLSTGNYELPNSDTKKCFQLLNSWVCVYGPCVPKVFESYLTETFFGEENNPSFYPFKTPDFLVKSDLLSAPDLIPLALFSDALQGSWKRLYSSSCDGLSFNRMIHHVQGYNGPICFLIKPQGSQNSVFGAFTSGRWKESNRFYGESDSFLFSLKPELRIMRSRDRSNGNYCWLNNKSYGMPHGLGLGGSMESFRFFIPETFEKCTAKESCLTFEGGKLLPQRNDDQYMDSITKSNFEIDYLEVWACGGEQFIQDGLKALAKEREIRDENIQKARKVDKAQFFNNSFDQEFLLSGTFAHRGQSRDAPDCTEKK